MPAIRPSDLTAAVEAAVRDVGAPAPLARLVADRALTALQRTDLAEDPLDDATAQKLRAPDGADLRPRLRDATAEQLRSAGLPETTITAWREGAARAAETDEEAIARLADPTPTVAPLPASVLAEIDASLDGLDLDDEDRAEVRRLAVDQAIEQRGPR